MKRAVYLYQQPEWPQFGWQAERLMRPLAQVNEHWGRLRGRMEALGLSAQADAMLASMQQEVVQSWAIEGEVLPEAEVRSSIARRLGLPEGVAITDRRVEGVVQVMWDATQHAQEPLTASRLGAWHAALFPTGYSGMYRIDVGTWRKGPIDVVSGALGKEKIHFEGPEADRLEHEMQVFFDWVQSPPADWDPWLVAGVAHLWFLTLHPFDDGNGRLARALTNCLLVRADGSPQRFYSLSAALQQRKKEYYLVLEQSQKGGLDVTSWLLWFLETLEKAFTLSEAQAEKAWLAHRFWQAHVEKPFNERQRKTLTRFLGDFEGGLNTRKWASMNHCSPDTALRDLQQLVEWGILTPYGQGRNYSYHISPFS